MPDTPKVVDREALKEFRKKTDQRYVLEGEYSPNTRVGKADVADNMAPYSEQSGATDTTPFVFQSSGGSSDIGSLAYLKALRGNTVVWNQLAKIANSGSTLNDITFTKIDDVTFSLNGTANADITNWAIEYHYREVDKSHKYLIKGITGGSLSTYYYSLNRFVAIFDDGIYSPTSNGSSRVNLTIKSGTTFNNQVFHIQIIDLTLMFGAGNEPTTVVEFNRLFPKSYYAYNAGELLSCKVNGYKTVGYNALSLDRTQGVTGAASNKTLRNFEEDKYYPNLSRSNDAYGPGTLSNLTQNSFTVTGANGYGVGFPVRIIAGQEYKLEYSVSGTGTNAVFIAWYDKNGEWLSYSGTTATAPNNAYWAVLLFRPNGTCTYTDIAFHLTWDGTRTGYEPYEAHTYGMPNVELKSAGNAYDELKPDGTLIRRIGVVDLGTLSWSYQSDNTRFISDSLTGMLSSIPNGAVKGNLLCDKYTTIKYNDGSSSNNAIYQYTTQPTYNRIIVKDSNYTDAATFKSAMSGVLLYYELAEPTEEIVTGYQEITPIDDWGTQEFLYDDTIDIPVPQGNEFFYPVDYKAFIDSVGGRDDVEYDAGALVSQTQLNNFLKTITGYDATKTQVLKNVTGTIQWVDEE